MIDQSSKLYYNSPFYVIHSLQESANKSREEAKLAREAKKLEAIERSKQRQLSEDYFKQRQVANDELILKKQMQQQQQQQQHAGIPVERSDSALGGMEGDDDDAAMMLEEQNDPFRDTKKSKSKIFVRWLRVNLQSIELTYDN